MPEGDTTTSVRTQNVALREDLRVSAMAMTCSRCRVMLIRESVVMVEAVMGAVQEVVTSVQEQGMRKGAAFKHLGGLPWRPCR